MDRLDEWMDGMSDELVSLTLDRLFEDDLLGFYGLSHKKD